MFATKTMSTLFIIPPTPQRSLFLCSLLLFIIQPVSASEGALPTDSASETIVIGETTYPIPKPWIGNRVVAPPLPMKSFRRIPIDHTHNGSHLYILKEAHSALVQLLEAAKEDGIVLRVESGYRSPGYQKKIFARMLSEGRDFNDIIRYVAPPGYSQHALGTAVDFFPSNWEFAKQPDYEWLLDNGAQFGFTETYPEHNALRYPWEAWHWSFQNTAGENIRTEQTQAEDTPLQPKG